MVHIHLGVPEADNHTDALNSSRGFFSALKVVRRYSALIIAKANSGDGGLSRYSGEYVIKVQGRTGETVLKGRLKTCTAG
jgi:hypothetical protein